VFLLDEEDRQETETITDNVSSHGFYCVSKRFLDPGRSMRAVLVVPVPEPEHSPDTVLVIHCQVVVVHANVVQGGYGVGFQITDYSVRRAIDPCFG
jgi:hypothetical protein